MLGIVFGWRKASKCKKLIRRALCRLKMLKKKRYSIVMQLREDLTELINNGYQQIALDRVEQLARDESLMEAYDLIENFCEFILVNLSYIRKHKTCPDDIIEAISSLIFASARCVDFPELKLVRKLFGERYGQSFAMAAVELCPGNLVNPQIKEKLLMKLVSDHEKQRLINEIARDCFHPAILALEYCPDWHQKQVLENGDQTYCEEPEIQDSIAEELASKVTCHDSSQGGGSDMVDPQCHSTSSSYLVSQSSSTLPDIKVPSGRDEVSCNPALASSDLLSWKAMECNTSGCIAASTLEDGLDGENDASSPLFPPISEEAIVYLDDVVELPNPSTEDGDLWDQRFFKFKSPAASMRENVQDGNDQTLIEHYDNPNEKSRSSKSINGSPKRSWRRSTCRENNSPSHTKKKLVKCCCLSCHSSWFTSEMENYYLGQPCYVYSDCNTDDISCTGDSNEEIEFNMFPQTQKIRSCEIGTVVYDVFIYSHRQPDENKEANGKPEEFSTKGKHESSLGFNGMEDNSTKYMKAASLTLQPSQDSKKENTLHSNSCPDKYPSHVHPKLPDYEEIAAKFIALKREYLQRKKHQCGN